MSTSIFGYPVLAGTALYGAADDPTDTAIMRDAVANSLLHYADSFAQVRVAAAFPGSAVTYNGATSGGVQSSPTANQYYALAGGVLGAWPITMHADGTPYALRIKLRGRSTNAAGSVRFRLVLCPLGRGVDYLDEDSDFVWTSAATTSTSFADLTGTTTANLLANRLVITAEQASERDWITRNVSSPSASEDPRAIEQVLLGLHIFAKTTNNTGVPQLSGIVAHEYVGT